MTVHILQVAHEPFEAIKSGKKTIESRLFDEKRQKMSIGDHITFVNRESPHEKVLTNVVGLLHYSGFEEMFSHNDPTEFGGESVKWLISQIRQFYKKEDEKKYGVIGIQIQLLR